MKKIKLAALLSLIIVGTLASMLVFADEGRSATKSNGEESMIPVTIQIEEKTFEASLYDNKTAKAFLAQLPMTVTMNEMNGNEKYYYLPTALPGDSQSIDTIYSGDIILYGSDCLVLFYEDFNTSYRYTKVGAISDPTGLSEALGRGSVQVTFCHNVQ